MIRPGFWRTAFAIALGVLLGVYAAAWLDGQDNTPEAFQDGGELPDGEPVGAIGYLVPKPTGTEGDGSRTYHRVTVAGLATTKWTHVEVCGVVTLIKTEEDGDTHLRLSDGPRFIVAEIVPYHRLPVPPQGQAICVRGISRYDKAHLWWEVHPVESWHAR